MQVFKPQKLGLLCRNFEHSQRFYLGIAGLAFVPFDRPTLLSEISMWKFAAEQLGKEGILDEGLPKPRGEFLVYGSAFAPNGKPATTCPVRARVGAIEKTLYVVGDRRWHRDTPTDPAPFTSMPIAWELAFGGPGFLRNPIGKGHGDGVLPNIETPGHMIKAPSQKPSPSGFRGYDLTWPQRMERAGTYDAEWLEKYFPGYPADVDWHVFNRAPEDQWLERGFFSGDEQFSFLNMHPEKPKVGGAFPRYRCRAFVEQRRDAEFELREVELNLSTALFFPAQERAILVWHGKHETLDDQALDVSTLLLACEAQEAPRPFEHYAAAREKRREPVDRALAFLDDSDLVPEGCADADPELARLTALLEDDGRLRKNQRKRAIREIEDARAIVAAEGLDPDEHAPRLPPAEEEAPPTLEQLPAYLENLQAQLESDEAERKVQREKHAEEMKTTFASLGLDYDAIRAEYEQPAAGPPKFSAADMRAKLEGIQAQCAQIGVTVDELDHMAADENRYAQWLNAEQELRRSYRMTAHHQGTVPRKSESESEAARREIVEGLARGESFRDRDLTAMDFSGLDLTGIDLCGAFLESASFAGANLTDADLTEAVLARADLSDTNLDGAKLTRANLGGAIFRGARAIRPVDLTEATLMRAELVEAVLPGALLERADLTEAKFGRTDLAGASMPEANLLQCDLRGVYMRGADLNRSSFLTVNLAGVDMSEAILNDTLFLTCDMTGANLARANLTGAKFVKDTVADGVNFERAQMTGANLRDTSCKRADFSGATLDDADLSGAQLGRAVFARAIAKETRFVKADLTDAVLKGANLMRAVFDGALLAGADLSASNLFESSFPRVLVDERTLLEGALQTGAKYLPKRVEKGERIHERK